LTGLRQLAAAPRAHALGYGLGYGVGGRQWREEDAAVAGIWLPVVMLAGQDGFGDAAGEGTA